MGECLLRTDRQRARIFNPPPLATWVVSALMGIAVILVMGSAGWVGTAPFPVLFDVAVWMLGLVSDWRGYRGSELAHGILSIVRILRSTKL